MDTVKKIKIVFTFSIVFAIIVVFCGILAEGCDTRIINSDNPAVHAEVERNRYNIFLLFLALLFGSPILRKLGHWYIDAAKEFIDEIGEKYEDSAEAKAAQKSDPAIE